MFSAFSHLGTVSCESCYASNSAGMKTSIILANQETEFQLLLWKLLS